MRDDGKIMTCDAVNPFNPAHRCTLGLGHPVEVAHTDGDATWLRGAVENQLAERIATKRAELEALAPEAARAVLLLQRIVLAMGRPDCGKRLAAEIFVALSESDQDLDLVAAETAVRVFAAWLRDEAAGFQSEFMPEAECLNALADTLDPKEAHDA
jgi:hypothetical protein